MYFIIVLALDEDQKMNISKIDIVWEKKVKWPQFFALTEIKQLEYDEND